MLRLAFLFVGLTLAAPALAAPPLVCTGSDPHWRLDLDAGVGVLDYLLRTEMELMLTTVAEGQDGPRALTLVGERDTAIVLLHDRACGTAQVEAQILTQRGQTPILLTGCCEPAS